MTSKLRSLLRTAQCMVRPCVARGFHRSGGFGLASMYPASDWSVFCSGPSWISARLRSHYQTGLERAIWVTRVRRRREDRSSISFHPLADLGRKTGLCYRSLLIGAVPLFVRKAVPSFSNRRPKSKRLIQFFCSTAPQAFFRPDRRFNRPARADTVKDGLLATAKGSAKRP